jgi:hypothetical protein
MTAAYLAGCGTSSAQILGSAEFKFPSGNVYSGNAVLVELWISFDQWAYAWELRLGDVACTDPTGAWSGVASPYANQPFHSTGTPVGGGMVDILVSQIHFPPAGFFANTDNPIMIWSGEWSTGDLTPRVVEIGTVTKMASVYIFNGAVPLNVAEASGEIVVIPSPVSLAPLVLAAFAIRRRRRMALA